MGIVDKTVNLCTLTDTECLAPADPVALARTAIAAVPMASAVVRPTAAPPRQLLGALAGQRVNATTAPAAAQLASAPATPPAPSRRPRCRPQACSPWLRPPSRLASSSA